MIIDEGEQWINLTGDNEGESKIEGQAKQNKEDKIEVNDSDIIFIQNGVGGYCKYENVAGFSKVTRVVERSGQYIQNGVELRPNEYDNDFGLERRWAVKTEHGNLLNYKNEEIWVFVPLEFKLIVKIESPLWIFL